MSLLGELLTLLGYPLLITHLFNGGGKEKEKGYIVISAEKIKRGVLLMVMIRGR